MHRFGHWYVVGPERDDLDTVKAFRVDRMAGASIGDASMAFDRPADFDAAAVLAEIGPTGGTGTARIRFDTEVVPVALRRGPGTRVLERDEGSALVEVPMSDESSMISWVLGFDDRAVIEEPPELRDAFVAFVGGSHDE